jgi:hypothetical protein
MKNFFGKGMNGKGMNLFPCRTFPCLLVLALCLLASGCSMVSGTRHDDGRMVVTSWRLLWKSEAISFTARDTNFSATLRIGKSAVDEQSVNAVTEAVVAGLVKGFVP